MDSIKLCKNCKEYKNNTYFYRKNLTCKECVKNKRKCIHNREKYSCKECCGVSFCEHKRRKSYCKECKGESICEHKNLRTQCKECKGTSICEHDILKSRCKVCLGGHICIHKKERNLCIVCGGNSICIHNIKKTICLDCKGGSICEHNKKRNLCLICNIKNTCKECNNVFVKNKTIYYPFCQACFCNKYPDHEKSTLYKIKERYLRDELRMRFPNNDINMLFDKKIQDGCSLRKPDVLIDCLTHCIIIECDENQHSSYKCEERRINELYLDLGDRPLIMIRFNPDNYIDKNNIKIEGCFKPLTKIEDMYKKKFYDINTDEWKRRVDILVKELKKYLDLNINILYKEIKLFYNEGEK